MKKLTITSTALAASLCFGTQSALAAGSLSDKDMLFAFGAESSVNTMMLSEREMVETEGEFIWFGYLGVMAVIRLAAPHVARYIGRSAGTGAIAGTGAAHYRYERDSVPRSDRQYGRDAVVGAVAGTVGGVYGPAGSAVASGWATDNYGNSSQNYGYQHPGNAGFGPGR